MSKIVAYLLDRRDRTDQGERLRDYLAEHHATLVATFMEHWPVTDERPKLARALCLVRQLDVPLVIGYEHLRDDRKLFGLLLAQDIRVDFFDAPPWVKRFHAGPPPMKELRAGLQHCVDHWQELPQVNVAGWYDSGARPGEEN